MADFFALSYSELVERVEQEFQSYFCRSPSTIAAAPGRVNLIGEHIDYNDGFVLPMAIDRYVVIAASPCDDQAVRNATFYSIDMQATALVNLDSVLEPQDNGWARYLQGVIAGFVELGVPIPALNAVIASNLPLGGGLSSSAALEVATATMLESMTSTPLTRTEKALLCQRAEHRFAGVPCGIMDQFSSVFGQQDELMLLDCRSQQIQPVPFLDLDANPGVTVLITNSNVRHELTGGEYAERRSQCESALQKTNRTTWRDVTLTDLEIAPLNATERRRARHVVGEIHRTTAAARAFHDADWSCVGQLMYASHASLRDDFEVSCEELDLLVVIAAEIGEVGGVYGSRMTGGGFGGCTVTLVKTDCLDEITAIIASRYATKTGIKPHCFASRPARGAHIIRAHR